MGHYHDQFKFQHCPVCGQRLEERIIKENEPERLVCTTCDFVMYLDPKVVACSILEIDSKLVLLKRDIEPRKGCWVIPGGYVERGERVEDAAIRETEEECGIKAEISRLVNVYSYKGVIPVVIVYALTPVSGSLVAGDETSEAALFQRLSLIHI